MTSDGLWLLLLDRFYVSSPTPVRVTFVAEQPEPVVSGNAAQTLFRIKKKMAEGTIKKKTDKGFGFIDIGGGEDMFFHSSNCEVSYDDLQEGQRVSFTEGQGPKGSRAENVRPI